MEIIYGSNVDLILPFPESEVERAVSWIHCYKSLMVADGMPATEEAWKDYIINEIHNTLSFGVIDKFNKLNYNHAAPLVGMVWFDAGGTPANAYFHFSSSRRAWGTGFMDEAGSLAIRYLFDHFPSVVRVSTLLMNHNKPAKIYTKKLGFKQDGRFADFVTQNGEPKAMAHFGLTRKEAWQIHSQVPAPLNLTSLDSNSEPVQVLEQPLSSSQTP